MNSGFDVIIVGSGPAGVSAAFPLVEAGLRVLMVDGGKRPDTQPPEMDFIAARTRDTEQWKWMVGENFHALKLRDAVSPKLRVPSQAYAFDGFGHGNQVVGKDFIAVGSLATGGLSNVWGCGVARFSANEIARFPFAASEIELSYARVSRRIGISGAIDDDLSGYFGLDEYSQPPIPMDRLHTYLAHNYDKARAQLNLNGFRLGRSRVAALSEDMPGRQACNFSGNCLWGCQRRSLYSATEDLQLLRKYANFSELPGFLVDDLSHSGGYWSVLGRLLPNGEREAMTARKVILAAGTLATTRIVLKKLNHKRPVTLLSCPTAAFLLWLPRLLGTPRLAGFALGQLSFSLALRDNITAFGSTFSTTGIPMSEFVCRVPMNRRYGIDMLRGLLSSCVVGNIFLPGHLTIAEAKLTDSGSLIVSGKYSDEVMPFMNEAHRKLRKSFRRLQALVLPGSFTVGYPGSDIHYAGTLPMRESPDVGETSGRGEVAGLQDIHVVDGGMFANTSRKVTHSHNHGECRQDRQVDCVKFW